MYYGISYWDLARASLGEWLEIIKRYGQGFYSAQRFQQVIPTGEESQQYLINICIVYERKRRTGRNANSKVLKFFNDPCKDKLLRPRDRSRVKCPRGNKVLPSAMRSSRSVSLYIAIIYASQLQMMSVVVHDWTFGVKHSCLLAAQIKQYDVPLLFLAAWRWGIANTKLGQWTNYLATRNCTSYEYVFYNMMYLCNTDNINYYYFFFPQNLKICCSTGSSSTHVGFRSDCPCDFARSVGLGFSLRLCSCLHELLPLLYIRYTVK